MEGSNRHATADNCATPPNRAQASGSGRSGQGPDHRGPVGGRQVEAGSLAIPGPGRVPSALGRQRLAPCQVERPPPRSECGGGTEFVGRAPMVALQGQGVAPVLQRIGPAGPLDVGLSEEGDGAGGVAPPQQGLAAFGIGEGEGGALTDGLGEPAVGGAVVAGDLGDAGALADAQVSVQRRCRDQGLGPCEVAGAGAGVGELGPDQRRPPAGVTQSGTYWMFEEFGNGRGISSVGLEDTVPQPPSSEERNSILDLFRR